VPLEEYLFFVVQSLVTGLFVVWLARRVDSRPTPSPPRSGTRTALLALMSLLWLLQQSLWQPRCSRRATWHCSWSGRCSDCSASGVRPGSILSRWRLAALGILAPTAYLALADTVPLGAGTWSIAPSQSLGWLILGPLPVEELTFFLLTNSLLVLGMILFMATESPPRARALAPG